MLIATDLDGTLVPAGATSVSSRTAAALAAADEAGVPVVFVTARPLRWMEPFWPHVGRHGRAIVSNGAVVHDVASRSTVRMSGIEPAAGLAAVEAIAAAVPGSSFAIECLDGMRLDPHYLEPDPVPDGTPRGPMEQIWDATAVKLLVRHGDAGADPDRFHEQVVRAVDGAAVCTWSTPGLVEISALGVTKATALAWLAQELQVPQDEVVAFGDMPNDLPMLRWAGRSYAVDGAHTDVLAAADHLAPGCEDDGVAVTIEELLRQR